MDTLEFIQKQRHVGEYEVTPGWVVKFSRPGIVLATELAKEALTLKEESDIKRTMALLGK